MKKNTKTNATVNTTENKANDTNLAALKSFISNLCATDETFESFWESSNGDKRIDEVAKYLEDEARKLITGSAAVVPVYAEDSTMRNWIIDFLRENNSKVAKATQTEKAEVKPKKETKKSVPVQKEEPKPSIKEEKPTSKPVSAKEIMSSIYAVVAEKEGILVLVRSANEADALTLAKEKAKAELNRQRLKMIAHCVSSVGAEDVSVPACTVHSATSEDDKCFVYTDIEGNYGVIFAKSWDEADKRLDFVDEYEEFTDEAWNGIDNAMLFRS